jgi:hypothetical protein
LLVFVGQSTGGELTKNTRFGRSGFLAKENNMKFSYEIEDMIQMSERWFDCLEYASTTFIDGTNACSLDDCDLRYIKAVMGDNPKMKRLMPTIILELMTTYQDYD